tara:strand:- start:228 stop:476 length:249 start_codon:yes stop_codon:yes gene_type:complete
MEPPMSQKNPKPQQAPPVSRAQSRRRHKQLEELARIRGVERKLHFEEGGSLHEWRGGLHTVTSNKKKVLNKRACRGKTKTDI